MFQSTHPRRVWHNFYFLLSLCTCFNPHTHAGCDSGRRAMRDAGSGFNPHTHAGCDLIEVIQPRPLCVSIHTPTQGVTGVAGLLSVVVWMFQSTHPRRVWRHLPQLIPVIRVFQSTHPRRVWHRQKFGKSGTGVSIHTPTQGVTQFQSVPWWCRRFQSTHPRRVWLVFKC